MITDLVTNHELVDQLNFKQKVDRARGIIADAYAEFGDGLVLANSLGKDSMAIFHLAMSINPKIKVFVVTTQFKPVATTSFMYSLLHKYENIHIFKSDKSVPESLPKSDPDKCCQILKVEPTSRALKTLNATAWITGLRCTEGRTRTNYMEIEQLDKGLVKVNPILLWHEREVWQYIAINQIPVNPLYEEGYRSLGCAPCTTKSTGPDERAGRWVGTSKCGGECGIHTRPLME